MSTNSLIICRTCMCEVQGSKMMQSIYDFVSEKSNKSIADLLLNAIPQLGVQPMDKLPNTICRICLDRLLHFIDFQEMCLASQSVLLQKLKTETHAQSTDFDLETGGEAEEELTKLNEAGTVLLICDVDPLLSSVYVSKEVDKAKPSKVPKKIRSNAKETKIEKRYLNDLKLCQSHCVFRKHLQRQKCEDESAATVASVENMELTVVNTDTPREERKVPAATQITYKDLDITETESCGTKHKRQKHLKPKKSKKDIKPLICEYCNKIFKQAYTLKEHIRIHTGEQPFLCAECGKTFKNSSNLNQHLLRHSDEKHYKCPDCPKKFPCRSDLASHKAVHRNSKRHSCDVCGAAFNKPYQLKMHKMYHTNEKPFQCEFCDMRFVCTYRMRRHIRIHTGEKPYECKYCVRAFVQSNDLIKHLRTHLGENVYRCELCPLGFRSANELREHQPLHKNDDEETRSQNLMALQIEKDKIMAVLAVNDNE